MHQVSTALGAVLREEGARERPCGVFGSFGWSGEAVDELQSRLKVCAFVYNDPCIRPSAHQHCRLSLTVQAANCIYSMVLVRQACCINFIPCMLLKLSCCRMEASSWCSTL